MATPPSQGSGEGASRISVFVSSPMDVKRERDRVARVCRRLSGPAGSLSIDWYLWEEGRFFSAHESFQPQIPPVEDFDLVVGILWSRIGSALPPSFPPMPDGRPYASGTAFELLSAIAARRESGARPDVLLYRKTADVPMPAGDPKARAARMAQLAELDAFVAEHVVNDAEGFKAAFDTFEDESRFEALFEAHLRSWLTARRRVGRDRRWRVETQGSPFRGLEAFDAGHREVFFGRVAAA